MTRRVTSYGTPALFPSLIVLVWLWVTNLAILFGAAFNAELERARAAPGGLA